MMEVSHAKSDSIAMMNTALSAMSVLVSFILGFLIVYANRLYQKLQIQIVSYSPQIDLLQKET